MALILLTGTVAAIVVRVPESYPWWYTVWVAITGGTATGTIAWLTAVIYTLYEELNIMVLSHIVRERDRKAAEARERDAEAREQDIDAREQEVDARQQEVDVRQQEVDAQQQEVAEREQALQSLAEHLPPEYRAEFERLAGNGKVPEKGE